MVYLPFEQEKKTEKKQNKSFDRISLHYESLPQPLLHGQPDKGRVVHVLYTIVWAWLPFVYS